MGRITPENVDLSEVRDVLLDMDGTLLDRRFDDYFWEELLPERYGRLHGIDSATAKRDLLARYRRYEGSLEWTDIDFWSEQISLDIAALKREYAHLIALHPETEEFLSFLRARGTRISLVTNAHPAVVELKMETTGIGRFFDRVIISHHVGATKESPDFWMRCEDIMGRDYKARALFVDDTERVLEAARDYGVAAVILRICANSELPAEPSERFPWICDFRSLMDSEFWTAG